MKEIWRTFIDYPEREYTQASGSGRPFFLEGDDIVKSAWKHAAVLESLMGSTYYVYIYLDPRKPGKYVYGDVEFDYEPFYIGKGRGDRIDDHIHMIGKGNPTNSFMISKVNRIFEVTGQYPIRRKLRDGLSDVDALELEQEWVGRVGRADLDEGPLTNHTNGGDGCRGLVAERNGMYGSGYKISGPLNGMYGVRGERHHCYGKPGYWKGRKFPRDVVERRAIHMRGDGNPMRKAKLEGRSASPWKGMTYAERFGEEQAKQICEKMSGSRASMVGDKNPSKRPEVVEKLKTAGQRRVREGTHNFVTDPPLRKPENKELASELGRKNSKTNPCFQGDTTWEEKFGVEKAAVMRKNASERNMGENNPAKRPEVRVKIRKNVKEALRKKRLQTVTV